MMCEICPCYVSGFGCVAEDYGACLADLLFPDDVEEVLTDA